MSQRPTTEWERKLGHPRALVAGVDEVGRGCLAGPVSAAAVILPAEPELLDVARVPWLSDVTDSKKLTPLSRARLAPLIRDWARGWAVASATVEEIDRLNILWASHLAMSRAVAELRTSQGDPLAGSLGHVLVDGNRIPKELPCRGTAIIKGDLKCLSIACASILAKVWRDDLMVSLDADFPGYGFAVHKGYPTPVHQEALERLGVTALHRRSFGPVAQRLARTP